MNTLKDSGLSALYLKVSAAAGRFLLRFSAPDTHKAVKILREIRLAACLPANSRSSRAITNAGSRMHTYMKAALKGRLALSKGSVLFYAENIFLETRQALDAIRDFKRGPQRYREIIIGSVSQIAELIWRLELLLSSVSAKGSLRRGLEFEGLALTIRKSLKESRFEVLSSETSAEHGSMLTIISCLERVLKAVEQLACRTIKRRLARERPPAA